MLPSTHPKNSAVESSFQQQDRAGDSVVISVTWANYIGKLLSLYLISLIVLSQEVAANIFSYASDAHFICLMLPIGIAEFSFMSSS